MLGRSGFLQIPDFRGEKYEHGKDDPIFVSMREASLERVSEESAAPRALSVLGENWGREVCSGPAGPGLGWKSEA